MKCFYYTWFSLYAVTSSLYILRVVSASASHIDLVVDAGTIVYTT